MEISSAGVSVSAATVSRAQAAGSVELQRQWL